MVTSGRFCAAPGLAGPGGSQGLSQGLAGRLGRWGALFGSGVAICLLSPHGKAGSGMFPLKP